MKIGAKPIEVNCLNKVRLDAYKTGLSPQVIYITDPSKAILLFWY